MRGLLRVKIQLPNGSKLTLDENTTLEDKQQVVEDLTEQWMSTIIANWDSTSVKYFLDNLANYLVWHKDEEDKNKQDKEILSIKKVEQMGGKRKAKSIPFSSLSKTDSERLFGENGVQN